jgi:hypothetical protein
LNQDEIIVEDLATRMLRKIDSNYTINNIVGSGQLNVDEADRPGAIATEIGINASGPALDSENRLYFFSGNTIYRIDTKDGRQARIEEIITNINLPKKSMSIEATEDVLYLAAVNAIDTSVDEAHSYIYKIKLSDHEGQWPLTFSYDDGNTFWVSKRWAGNGDGVLKTDNWEDVADATAGTIGYPRAMLAYAPGVLIYYSLQSSNSANPNGQHQIRMVREIKDQDGNVIGVENLKLGKNSDFPCAWTSNIAKDHLDRILVSHHGPWVEALELRFALDEPAPSTLAERYTHTTFDISLPGCTGNGCEIKAEAVTEIFKSGEHKFVASDSQRGNLYLLDQSFQIIDIWARKSDTDDAIVLAQEAVIQNPDGIAQDQQNNVYIFEGQKSTIRKVYAAGGKNYVNTFAGVAFKNELIDIQVGNTLPLSQATFDSRKSSHNVRGGLAYHQDSNSLYVASGVYEGHNQVDRINLSQNTIETVIKDPNGDPWIPTDPTAWKDYLVITGFELYGDQLLLGRAAWNTHDTYDWAPGAFLSPALYYKFDIDLATGSLTENADQFIIDNPNVRSPAQVFWASTTDTDLHFYNIYIKGDADQTGLWVRKGTEHVKLDGTVFQDIEVIEHDGAYHLFLIAGRGLLHAKVEQAPGGSTAQEIADSYTRSDLAIPGTFLDNPRQIVRSNDGGLLISDYNRGRVIEYFIFDEDGNMILINK